MINTENYLDEIKGIMAKYIEFGINPDFLVFSDEPFLNVASAIVGMDKETGKKDLGIRINRQITDNEISSAKGAIGFNKKTKEFDGALVELG